MIYHLAIDIGASSGRHILGWIENGILCTEEIYRFDNNFINKEQKLVWDINNLVFHVKRGIKVCNEIGKIPKTVAIDTWGVDYILLDKNKKELFPAYCYRDSRTQYAVSQVENVCSAEKLYEHTGIQKQNFNTVYQLWCDKEEGKLDIAEYFMMMPEYLSYCLTGEIKNEYTNATTTGMVNAQNYMWDSEITDALGYPSKLFRKLLMPGDEIGNFKEEMREYAGFDAKVIFCPSHDTASAVAACPLDENDIFISSGTWSLIGCEKAEPVLSETARECNFTNEGGINYRFRFLKNYMGMWLFQNIRRNLDKKLTYDEMMYEAKNSNRFFFFDVNSPLLVAPENMIDAIKELIGVPDLTLGEVLNSVYHSLAKSYKDAVSEVEEISGIKAKTIRIVGGGSKDSYLNYLTKEYSGKNVTAGPVEATALGNIASQIMSYNKDCTLKDLRNIIKKSFDIKEV